MERCAQDRVIPKDVIDDGIQTNGGNHPYPIVHHPHKWQQGINGGAVKTQRRKFIAYVLSLPQISKPFLSLK